MVRTELGIDRAHRQQTGELLGITVWEFIHEFQQREVTRLHTEGDRVWPGPFVAGQVRCGGWLMEGLRHGIWCDNARVDCPITRWRGHVCRAVERRLQCTRRAPAATAARSPDALVPVITGSRTRGKSGSPPIGGVCIGVAAWRQTCPPQPDGRSPHAASGMTRVARVRVQDVLLCTP